MRTLSPNERILTAYAEGASGPGWANQPLWVVIRNGSTGNIRLECIQPAEQTNEMRILYRISSAIHGELTTHVRKFLNLVLPPVKQTVKHSFEGYEEICLRCGQASGARIHK